MDTLNNFHFNITNKHLLLFPLDISRNSSNYSILGLGDIIIPGFFLAFLMKFDMVMWKVNIGETEMRRLIGDRNFGKMLLQEDLLHPCFL